MLSVPDRDINYIKIVKIYKYLHYCRPTKIAQHKVSINKTDKKVLKCQRY